MMKMKHKWSKNCKRIMAAILLWVCVLWPTKSQAQADVSTGVYPVYLVDGNGVSQYFGPGVCVNDGGTFAVFTSPCDDSVRNSAVVVVVNGQKVLLDYVDDSGGMLWKIHSQEDLAGYESEFLSPGSFSRNDGAMVYYHYESDGELILAGTEVTLLGITSVEDTDLLDADSYPTGVLYPASVVNGQEQIVGILLEDNVCVLVGRQSTSTTATAPATAPPLPDRGTGSSVPAGGGTVSTISRDGGGMILLLLAVGVILVIALVVLIIVLAGKKKSSPGNGGQPGTSGNTGGTASSSRAEKSVSGKGQQICKLWLLAKGGCMNGRVYPVEQSEITIGRDAAMVIRFPADTAGVSRIHAKLYWQGGQLMLMDCNSTSGTFLKRQGKLTPMAPVAVQSGDVFYIGEKTNSFEISTGR